MEAKDCKPLISVIIPVYNGQKFIRQTVRSVLEQPYKNVEILLINDGSSDKSDEICRQLAEQYGHIRYFSKKNEGIGATRNFGISITNGKYIAFLDQDDIWYPNFLNEKVTTALSENYDIYGFSYYECSENLKRGRYRAVHTGLITEGGLTGAGSSWNHHSSFLFSKELLKKHDIQIVKTRHEDEIFRIMCLYVSKTIQYIDIPMFCYRNNHSSETHKSFKPEDLYLPIIDSWNSMELWFQERFPNDCKIEDMCISGIESLTNEMIAEMLKQHYSPKTILNLCKQSLPIDQNTVNSITEHALSKKNIIRQNLKGSFIRILSPMKKTFLNSLWEMKKYPITLNI